MTDSTALWLAVDSLTTPVRHQIRRDDGSVTWQTVDSVWHQLVDAVISGQGSARRGKQESKPPLDAEALSLKLIIEGTVSDACMSYMLERQHDTAKDLRRLASEVLRMMDTDLTQWWVECIQSWTRQAVTVISSDPDRDKQWAMACPNCRTHFTYDQADGTRRPVIRVKMNNGLTRWVECIECGWQITRAEMMERVREAS